MANYCMRYQSSSKTCASCAYWGGERKSTSMGKVVEVHSANAKCEIPRGASRGSLKSPVSRCPGWQKWQQLK